MLKKDKIYGRVEDKHVKTTIVYADGSKVLHYDSAATTDKVAKADLLDLFLKGVTIKDGESYYKPTSYTTAGIAAGEATYTGTEATE